MNNKYLLFVVAVFLVVSIVGCNTFRGAGKDVENAGVGVQKIVNHND